jgi:cellulose synthase operon protein C
MNLTKSSTSAAISGLLLSLLLAACGGDNTASLLASAKEYLAKNDGKAAIIQIKNALQKNPNSAEARFMLGSVLLDGGDVSAAEVEFRKALELKQSPELALPQLAKAMLGQGQFKKVIDEFSKTTMASAQATADLQMSLATAYAALGKNDLSQAALTASLAAEPSFAPALLAQARQKAVARDFDGAIAGADDVIAKAPKSFEAWKLKGDILYFLKNQPADALAAYRKVVEIKPDILLGYNGILTILLAQNNLTEAAKELEQLKKIAPNHPQSKYLQAQLAYQQRDFKLARDLSQQLLKIAPDNPRGLQLAGAVELQLNSLLQAEALLAKAVQSAPDLVLARRLLILTYLRSGQPAKALAALAPSLNKETVDPENYSVAGEVYLQNGDIKKAEEYFTKASKLDPKDARKRTSLALTHMMDGREDSAFGELQDISASDSGVTADLALISAHLRRKEYDKALGAIDVFERKQPDKPLASNLRGTTQLAKQDLAGARKSFERALALDPTYFPAVASLAGLDLIDKKPEEAKKRFEAVLAKDPKNGQSLLALAELAARSGAGKEEVGALIAKAVTANPTEAAPRLLLIDFYMRSKDDRQALSTAQNAVAAIPDNADLLDALGRVQQSSGDINQAVATFNKLAGMQPLSTKPLLRLADAHMAAKNKDAATQSLRKALEVKADLLEAQRGLVMLNLDGKKYPEALAISRTVQKQRPKEPVGYILEGDVAAVQKNWDAATAAYRTGLKESSSSELALKLHAVLAASGKEAESDKFAAEWVKSHGDDAAFLFYMGDIAIKRKEFGAAEKNYAAVVRLQPNNAVAYNNLAWVTGRLNKNTAIGFAETALKLSPNQPAFMDTLAMLLSGKNDYAKAIEWQGKAVALEPANTLFKLNLAKIHIQGGKKDLARKELDELAKLGDKFAAQDEVATLLKSL